MKLVRVAIATGLLMLGMMVPASATESQQVLVPEDQVEYAIEALETENAALNELQVYTYEADAALYQNGVFPTVDDSARFMGLDTSTEGVYNTILEGLRNHVSEIDIRSYDYHYVTVGSANTVPIFQEVINNQPELFYVENKFGYTYSGTQVLSIRPTYRYVDGEIDRKVAELEKRVSEILAEVNQTGMTELDRVLATHDYLVNNIAYNKDVGNTGTSSNQMVYNVWGALMDGDAVCQGYALAFKLLMDEMNIKCIVVPSAELNHMWNMVVIEGNWYHLDVTWDDPFPNRDGMVQHNYFLKTEAEFKTGNHGLKPWDGPTPSATSTTFQTGYAFINNIYEFRRAEDGTYYYIDGSGLKKGPLETATGTTEEVVALDQSWVSGIGWLDGDLYYFAPNRQSTFEAQAFATTTERAEAHTLYRFELEDERIWKLEDVTFDRTMMGNSTSDALGLKIDVNTREIKAVSSQKGTASLTYQLDSASNPTPVDRTPYPSGWTGMDALAGITGGNSGAIYLGIRPENNAGQIYLAFYEGGKMVGIQTWRASSVTGQSWLKLSSEKVPATYDAVKAFLISENSLQPLSPTVIKQANQ